MPFLGEAVVDRGATLITAVIRIFDDAVLIEHGKRRAEPRGAVAARQIDRVLLYGSRPEDLILPVDALYVAVILDRAPFAQIGFVEVGFGHDLLLERNELIGVHQVDFLGYLSESPACVESYLRRSGSAQFGGDYHYAVGGAGAVYRGRRGVFENADRSDVRGVEGTHRGIFQRETVDDVERRVGLRDGVAAADDDIHLLAGHAFVRSYLHAGYAAREGFADVAGVGFEHVADVGASHAARQVLVFHFAVADDHDFVETGVGGGQHDVYLGFLTYGNFLRHHAQKREHETCGRRYVRKDVTSFRIGYGAPVHLFNDDGGSLQRQAVGTHYGADDLMSFGLRPGRSRHPREEYGENQPEP